MQKGKIIVIEGTDCSGKETQSKLLIEKLNSDGMNTVYYGFPDYASPTGKIIGLPYLGKEYLAAEFINNYRNDLLAQLHGNEEIVNNVLDNLIEKISRGVVSRNCS